MTNNNPHKVKISLAAMEWTIEITSVDTLIKILEAIRDC